MSHPRADIALLTDRRYVAAMAEPDDWYLGNILADDGLLQAGLAGRGRRWCAGRLWIDSRANF